VVCSEFCKARYIIRQFNAVEIHTPREQVHDHVVSKHHFTYVKVEIQDNNSLS